MRRSTMSGATEAIQEAISINIVCNNAHHNDKTSKIPYWLEIHIQQPKKVKGIRFTDIIFDGKHVIVQYVDDNDTLQQYLRDNPDNIFEKIGQKSGKTVRKWIDDNLKKQSYKLSLLPHARLARITVDKNVTTPVTLHNTPDDTVFDIHNLTTTIVFKDKNNGKDLFIHNDAAELEAFKKSVNPRYIRDLDENEQFNKETRLNLNLVNIQDQHVTFHLDQGLDENGSPHGDIILYGDRTKAILLSRLDSLFWHKAGYQNESGRYSRNISDYFVEYKKIPGQETSYQIMDVLLDDQDLEGLVDFPIRLSHPYFNTHDLYGKAKAVGTDKIIYSLSLKELEINFAPDRNSDLELPILNYQSNQSFQNRQDVFKLLQTSLKQVNKNITFGRYFAVILPDNRQIIKDNDGNQIEISYPKITLENNLLNRTKKDVELYVSELNQRIHFFDLDQTIEVSENYKHITMPNKQAQYTTRLSSFKKYLKQELIAGIQLNKEVKQNIMDNIKDNNKGLFSTRFQLGKLLIDNLRLEYDSSSEFSGQDDRHVTFIAATDVSQTVLKVPVKSLFSTPKIK